MVVPPGPEPARKVGGFPTLPGFADVYRRFRKKGDAYGYRILEHSVANDLLSVRFHWAP